MNKKKFIEVELMIVTFESDEVLTGSGGNRDTDGMYGTTEIWS